MKMFHNRSLNIKVSVNIKISLTQKNYLKYEKISLNVIRATKINWNEITFYPL